jgi:hypothetical protein
VNGKENDMSHDKYLTLEKALSIVLELANQNVLEGNSDDDGWTELQEEQERQEQACLMVEEFIQVINDDATAALAGEVMIEECQLKKKKNGRVELKNGDKTAIGMTRTMFGIMSQFAKGISDE